jgi:hypothetical protein
MANKYVPTRGEPELGKPCSLNGKLVKVYTEYHWREWVGHETYGKGPNPIQKARIVKTK